MRSHNDLECFFKNKKVLITGFNGFKGSWLTLTLQKMGAHCYGLSEQPKEEFKLQEILEIESICKCFYGDIRNKEFVQEIVEKVKPYIIYHLAAQPLVREAYLNPYDTFTTNALGTLNLYEAIKKTNRKTLVLNITTDKVYENKEWPYSYRENDIIGGVDPYSASKSTSELISRSYQSTYFKDSRLIKSINLRAGNVIGGGDFAKDRIIVDLVSSIFENKLLEIRNPAAVRPWQYIQDLIYGYLLAASYIDENDSYEEAFNFAPSEKKITVKEVCDKSQAIFPKIKINVKFQESSIQESQLLQLNADLAKSTLDWMNLYSFDENLRETLLWYETYFSNKDLIKKYTHDLVDKYFKKARNQYGN